MTRAVIFAVTLTLALFSLAGRGARALTIDGVHDELRKVMPKSRKSLRGLGVVVKSLKTGKAVFEYNPEKAFVPASNAKIIVSVTALWLLGPDYRFKTEFYTGGDITDGVLDGNLYIKGYGNPMLTTANLVYVAREFEKLGLKRVAGDVVVDDSYFDSRRYGPGWKRKWRGEYWSPPVSALSLNFNTIDVSVSPLKPGGRPVVELGPQGSGFTYRNEAVTRGRRSRLRVNVLGNSNTVLVKGAVASRAGKRTITRPVPDPALYAGWSFEHSLREAGIEVGGKVVRGRVPDGAKNIYTHYSERLDSIVSKYNKASVNIVGENLFKTLGAVYSGAPGTWKKGAGVVGEFLERLGLGKEEVTLVDGSGLSPLNRVTPRSLVDILGFAYTDRAIGLKFITSLSIGGVDGTLEHRLGADGIRGRVLAKTGYISGVYTLSGYLFTRTNDVLAFSILSNGVGPRAKKIQQDILLTLVKCCGEEHSAVDDSTRLYGAGE